MHRLAQHRLWLVLGVAVLAVAACGGSGGGSKPGPASPGLTPSTTATGAQAGGAGFAAQVRAVCRRANVAAASAEGDAQKLAAVLDRYLPEFRAITAPASLQPSYDQLLSNLNKISAALKRKDIAAVKQLENQDHPLAAKLGIRRCAA